MTAASCKPVHPLTRLHLGCGESLSQLLPDPPAPQPARPDATARKRQDKPRAGGRK